MRKFVVMTAYSRPEYLRQTLESIRDAQPQREGYDVYISVDPSPVLGEIMEVIHSFGTLVQIVEINKRRMGDLNARSALTRAFGEFGAEVALYCQDDVTLTRDVFYLINWWARLVERDKYMCLWTHNYESDMRRPFAVVEDRGDASLRVRKDLCRFHGEAFAVSRENFERYFVNNWHPQARAMLGPNKTCQGEFHCVLEDNPELCALVPALSRANHIGRVGGGSRPSFHDRVYTNHPVSDRTYVSDFSLYDIDGAKLRGDKVEERVRV